MTYEKFKELVDLAVKRIEEYNPPDQQLIDWLNALEDAIVDENRSVS